LRYDLALRSLGKRASRRASTSSCALSRREEDGFVLVAVLWMLAALATLASIYSAYAIQTADAAHSLDDRVQAEESVRSAIEMTVYRLLSAPKQARPSQGEFTLKVGRTGIAVRFRSEAARIDLNAAPPDLLAGIFTATGVESGQAKTYADRVVGWRAKPDSSAGGNEAKLYSASGSAYPPRQAPFDNGLELALVLGLPAPVVARVLPFVTVFSGRPEIDVACADRTVLAALPGMTPEILSAVLKARTSDQVDQKALLSLLGPAKSRAMTGASKTVRSGIEVKFDNGRRVRAEVVFRLKEGDGEPYDILSWRDDLDGPTPIPWESGR
jgi:general secretion pathway protein K